MAKVLDRSRNLVYNRSILHRGIPLSEKTFYGGQAVIEGVMMRGRRYVACAVREPQGSIVLISEALAESIYSSRWARVPFLRAITILWDTLVLGTKMLMFSANIAAADENSNDRGAASASGSVGASVASGPVSSMRGEAISNIPPALAWGTLAVSLAFGIGLFFVFPLFIVSLIDPMLNNLIQNSVAASVTSNLIEGLVRLGLFLAYIIGIGFLPDVKRVFQYHGAEHKTIAAEEAGAPMTPQSIQRFGKEHPRCGTGFLLVVVVVSIVVFAMLGQPPILIRIASRILLIPVVAALSYELIKFSSAHRENPLLFWLVVQPSLALQSLTTREPDDQMVQVAIAALQCLQSKERARELA